MKKRRNWVVWLLLITGLIVTIYTANYVRTAASNVVKKEFTYSCNEISIKINDRLHAHAQVLQSGAALFNVSDTVTRQEWKTFIEESKMHLNLPGIQGTGFSLIVPANVLKKHIQHIRHEGFPEYTVRPEGMRETYTSIIYLEPFNGRNLRAFGYDMFSEPVRREAMERARDHNVAALSGKVMLVQETGTDVQAGNLMYVPVYRKGAEINTLEQRRHAIIGWVYSPYRMNDLMMGILEGWKSEGNQKFYLHIFDGSECTAQSLLFESHAPEEQKASENIRFSVQMPVDFNGHRWTLVFTQTTGNIFLDYIGGWTLLFSGILISILLFLLANALINIESKAWQKAEQLTSELKESEKRFQIIFEASPVPLSLTRLSDGVIVLANKLLGELFLISTTEAIGKKSPNYYVNPNDRNEIVQALANDGFLNNYEIQMRKEDGQLFWGLVSFQIISIGSEPLILSGFYDIDKRKQAEEEIRNLSSFNQRILNNVGEGIYGLDNNGNCTFINRIGAQLLGYEIQELIGLQMHDNHHCKKKDGTDYGRNECPVHQSLEKGQVYRISDEVFWHKNGTSFPVEYTTTPIIENGEVRGVVVIFSDITMRKKDEEEIHRLNLGLEQKVEERTKELAETNLALQKEIEERGQAEERIRLVYEASPYSIMLIDSKGTVRLANQTTQKYFGYGISQLIGVNIGKLIPKSLDIDLPAKKSSFYANPENRKMGANRELYALKRDGSMFPVEIGLNPIEIDGERMVLTNIIDITERKEAENIIKQARQEAEQANMAKSEFLSRMSHELRTPMNSILGFAQLMDMGELKPAQKKGVDHILKSGKHLLDLINEVLDISKIEAGHISLSLEPIAICPLIQEVLDVVSPLSTDRQITLETTPNNKFLVIADRQRLKQVLINLVNNAIKYNRTNGFVKIYCELQAAAENQIRTVRISISDSGEGILPEDIKKLFTPFERIGAEKSGIEGTGLGLAVAKKMVDAMNCKIGVDSKVGFGSTFWIELPQAESQIGIYDRINQIIPDSGKGGVSGIVLYIEDNSSNMQLVEQILATHRPDIRLITEMYGKNAVKLATDFVPDMILLDLDLPDIHGSEVLKLLQDNHKTLQIPVVVVSADVMEKQIEKLLKGGAKDYLAKPLDVVTFLKVVDRIMNRE